MALEVMVRFLGLARSVSRRVVKLAVPRYLFRPLPPQKRGHAWAQNQNACHVHDSKYWEWVRLW